MNRIIPPSFRSQKFLVFVFCFLHLSLSLWLAVFVCCWPLPCCCLLSFVVSVLSCLCLSFSPPFVAFVFCCFLSLSIHFLCLSLSSSFVVVVFCFSLLWWWWSLIMMTMVSPDLESIDQVIPQTCQQPPKSLTSIHFGRCFWWFCSFSATGSRFSLDVIVLINDVLLDSPGRPWDIKHGSDMRATLPRIMDFFPKVDQAVSLFKTGSELALTSKSAI